MAIVANDYRGRFPVDNIRAMLHDEACSDFADYGHLDWWNLRFETVPEGEALFNHDRVYTDPRCLAGQGTHLDRSDR